MTDDAGLVSIVIPAYNAARYLHAALESALNQTYRGDKEIIVVDDGSSDDTPAVVAACGGQITYLRQDHRGPASARNRGLRRARGEFIAFLDADDLWRPEKLQRQMEIMRSRPDVGLVCCDFQRFTESGVFATSNKRLAEPASGWVFRELWQRNFISTPTVVLRRECLDAVGLFDEALSYGEDWHLWLRVARHFKVHYVDAPLVSVRCHPQSISAGDPDQRLAAHLATLDDLVRLFPDLAKSVRVRRSKAYFGNGWRHFAHGRRRLARQRFRQAMGENPGMARACVYLAATYMPGVGVSLLRAGKQWLRRLAQRREKCVPGFRRAPVDHGGEGDVT